MKIGLYFGTFNPIHVGHMIIANHMAEHSDLNQFWMVVTPHNPPVTSFAVDSVNLGVFNEIVFLHDDPRHPDREHSRPVPWPCTINKNDINIITEPNCTNIGVLKNNIPFSKNYLKNYYKDLYGNRVEAELIDYFTAYYTLINSDDNIGLPVNTQIGHSNFIIPEQYKYDSKFNDCKR